MTDADKILQTIDLSCPINCPHFRREEDLHCRESCRFRAICEAAREEFGE